MGAGWVCFTAVKLVDPMRRVATTQGSGQQGMHVNVVIHGGVASGGRGSVDGGEASVDVGEKGDIAPGRDRVVEKRI